MNTSRNRFGLHVLLMSAAAGALAEVSSDTSGSDSGASARTMRAKMQVSMVQEGFSDYDEKNQKLPEGQKRKVQETLSMHAVSKSTPYSPDGVDDDNTYARWSPGGTLQLNVANPNLFGKFKHGDKFYLDFTPAAA